MTPEKRVTDVWHRLPISVRLHLLMTALTPYYLQTIRGIMTRKPARWLFVAVNVAFILFFWLFAPGLPARVNLIAGIVWGGVTIAVIIAIYSPPPDKK